MTGNEFDELVKGIPNEQDRMDVIDACDSAYMAMKWFKAYGLAATAADIVALAGLITRPKFARILADRGDISDGLTLIAQAVEGIDVRIGDVTGTAKYSEVDYIRTRSID